LQLLIRKEQITPDIPRYYLRIHSYRVSVKVIC